MNAAALLFFTAVLATWATAAPPIIPEGVKLRVRQRVDNGYTPGIAICMVNADGRTYYNYGRIAADSEIETDETALYEIASVTKTFTTTLLAQMVENGDVTLSDKVESFLPESVSMPSNGGDTITLRHLANHTSGLPNTPPNLPETVTDLANQFENYTADHLYEFLNDYRLPRSPGAAWEYSNAGMGLLGLVLALSQNTDYETLLRERVLSPMGLSDTAIELTEAQETRVAPGHHGVVQRPPFRMNILSPAGALKSCTVDLGTYLEYHMGIESSALDSALTLSQKRTYDRPGNDFEMGLGWWLWDRNDTVQHGGDSFGSTAFLGFSKSNETGVVILSNNRSHYPASITDLGFHCLNPDAPLELVPNTTPISEEALRAMVGDYGIKISSVLGRPVLQIPGQIDYTCYDNRNGGLSTLDIGLSINMNFNIDQATGLVESVTYTQNDGADTILPRIRHPGQLSIASSSLEGVQLQVAGEGDTDYTLESSTDLVTWESEGTIDIWEARNETGGEKYFRIDEP